MVGGPSGVKKTQSVKKKTVLVTVTSFNGDGPYLINPKKLVMVSKATSIQKSEIEGEPDVVTILPGSFIWLEEGNGRHVQEDMSYFANILE